MLNESFEIIYLVGFVLGSIVRGMGTKEERKRQKENGEKPKKDLLLFFPFFGMVLIPFTYLFSSLFDFANYQLPVWVGACGTIVFVAAIWMLWRSHADLGKNWSHTVEFKDDQKLVTDGVYRNIRHPMYSAHWLWAIAQAMLLQNWFAGFSFLVLFLPMYLMRIRVEEKEMIQFFGNEYREYMKRTGRVIPRF